MDPHSSTPKLEANSPFLIHRYPASSPPCFRSCFLDPSPHAGAMTGPARTAVARKHVQPPRPPNAWIIYRSEKIRILPPLQPGEARRAQADVSRMISEMWKNETDEERSRYERMAEQKKAEHQQKYPGYRFQPQKKEEKQRLREMMKQERQNSRETRKNRSRVPPASTPTPSLTSQSITPFYTPETLYGHAGPSPPLSAAPSPRLDNPSSPESDDLSIPTPNASRPPISAEQNASISIISPFATANTAFHVPSNHCWVATHPTTLSSEWNHQDRSNMPILPTPVTEFVSFDIPAASSEGWMNNEPSQELEEALQSFLSATADPSIFHLNNIDVDHLTANPTGEIQVSMGEIPLAFENILSPEGGLNYTSFDFSNVAGPSSQTLDIVSPSDNAPVTPPVGLCLDSALSDSATYNVEEYLNFEETFGSATPTEAVASAQGRRGSVTTLCSSSYVPPSGAAYSSTRRVGGTWKRPWGVPAN